jgi:hypothetical protein
MMTLEELEQKREERGLEIANKKSQVIRMEASTYTVHSQSGNGEYVVCLSEDEWRCECPEINDLLKNIENSVVFVQTGDNIDSRVNH